MIYKIIKFWKLIPNNRKLNFKYLIILMIASSVTEMISIGAVVPFLAIILEPDKALKNLNLMGLEGYLLNINSENIVVIGTIFFIICILISGCLRLIVSALNMRIAYVVGSEISQRMFYLTLYQDYSVHLSRNSSETINAIMSKSGVAITCIINVLNIIFI